MTKLYHYRSLPYAKLIFQGLFRVSWVKNPVLEIIPYSRANLSNFSTLSQTKLPKTHTRHSGTYLKSLYMELIPCPRPLFYKVSRIVHFKSPV